MQNQAKSLLLYTYFLSMLFIMSIQFIIILQAILQLYRSQLSIVPGLQETQTKHSQLCPVLNQASFKSNLQSPLQHNQQVDAKYNFLFYKKLLKSWLNLLYKRSFYWYCQE